MTEMQNRDYLLISPCRDEAEYMRRTLDSVVAQTVTPALWIVVDDGSTDATPEILAEYAARHDWIRVVQKPDRGGRAVGPGVIEAFYHGLDTVDLADFPYLCKLDLDLDLPSDYFETLIARMEQTPRLGSASGRSCYRTAAGELVSEGHGTEMSEGMTKFYRRECFRQIGGFVREVMWDGIDCHTARRMGWIVRSYDDLKFEHLRPMGSSQKGIYTGRRRHGAGQYYMGSDPLYFTATAIRKMARKPYVMGGLATLQGYFGAWMRGAPRHEDAELRRFIRSYQRNALLRGKSRTIARIEAEREAGWRDA
ncbi:glycosyltransferase family A protein [Palleronia sp. LCG004]|uniref:glycosyltransferase n=1 Tax=Palleronia sp. LCG004 TaxID=3079304 RepID=UPI002942FC1F|nr:glycosyltransferase family A protein [Palleronia sp. LCG004]WOI58404.1 glycosyltransferase family A protein [Palleronia sp. LCG004]